MACGEVRLSKVDVERHSNRCDAWSLERLSSLQIEDDKGSALVDRDQLSRSFSCEYYVGDHTLMPGKIADCAEAMLRQG